MIAEVALQGQEVQAEIEENARKIETQRQLSVNAANFANGGDASVAALVAPVAVILRAKDGEMQEIEGGMAAELQPGDVVDLRLPAVSTN